MLKEIKLVDAEKNIAQITTTDERWYSKLVTDTTTGLPAVEFRPSCTYICGYYPKGPAFEAWLKRKGPDADMIRDFAGERGYKVHRAIAQLNDGERVAINDVFEDDNGVRAPLSSEEYAAVLSYADWWETEGHANYEILDSEYNTWPDGEACEQKYGIPAKYFFWAGTVDLKLRRKSDDSIGIVDMKTSSDIWPSHRMQVCGYKRAEGADWCGILRLNYRRNKTKKWKYDDIADCYHLFCATWEIWKAETEGTEPLQRDFPLAIKLSGVEPRFKKNCQEGFEQRIVSGRQDVHKQPIPDLWAKTSGRNPS